jgi:hypothetical protein
MLWWEEGGRGGLGQAISQTSWKDPSFQRLGQHFPNRIRSGDCRLLQIAPFPPSSPKDAGGQKRDLNGARMAAICDASLYDEDLKEAQMA